MSTTGTLLIVGGGLLVAIALSGLLVYLVTRRLLAETRDERGRQAELAAQQIRTAAENDAQTLRRNAEIAADATRREAELAASEAALAAHRRAEQETEQLKAEVRALQADLERREQRLSEREQRLDAEFAALSERAAVLDAREQQIVEQREALTDLETERVQVLERTAQLSTAEAKAEILKAVEHQARLDAAVLVRDLETAARETADMQARKIITTAIQRVASETTTESVVSVLHLPSDEMKGRIIGREGRNIRTFESVTGVNLIVDDTPEAVLLSCFDPVRREVGRLTLEKLVEDGRIHPHRIEEIYERSKTEIDTLVVRAGEDALIDLGISEMHPDVIELLGRLRYRTSYGQNVLKHLVEAAHIAGMIAAEMRMPVPLVKRCAVLHDLGKALTHEVEGSHAMIGAEVARRYGEVDDVVHAIEAHHNEVEPRTVEAVLVQAADAISGGRPGARRESLESYVKRVETIEQIARSKAGVEKVFAMQAGREVRVMVLPEAIDDIAAQVLARDIAKQIEEELTYPGQIKVTVVRESRATEVAR